MDNNYHLLIETSLENFSLFMRKVNSNYAIYFNKKYKRAGHLWQGRYKSWYVIHDDYLYSLFKYIEYLRLGSQKKSLKDYKMSKKR
jgi:hypothetical protein